MAPAGDMPGAPTSVPATAPADRVDLAEVRIAPMRRRHLRGVVAIEEQTNHRPWSSALFMGELRMPTSRFYVVAMEDHEVVGFSGLMLVADEGHLTNVAVHPQRRRRSIAARLMLVTMRRARALGLVGVTLEVRMSNTAAQELYRRFGFVPGGVRRNYYADVGEDALDHVGPRHRHRFLRRTAAGHRISVAVAAQRRPPLRRGADMNDPTESDDGPAAPGRGSVGPSTMVLGIETSCDETAAACVLGGRDVMSSVVSSQVDLHARYGGVVPEIASRAHNELIIPVTARALVEAGVDGNRIDAVAATTGPGLIGALLVGVSAAKALALTWDVPFIAVNHLEAHLYAAFLEDPDLTFPLVVLLVSGGHTMLVSMEGHGRYRLLGQTLDDAAGEAFDKVARFLGLGYPGGPAIDHEAMSGDPEAIRFPRAMLDDGLDFSFSGIKTSVVNHVRKHPDVDTADVAASFQAAVVDVLVTKARRAAQQVGATALAIGGGVAANSLLREQFLGACTDDGLHGFLPSRSMCTDNAAMIASAGWFRLGADGPTPLDHGADPNLRLSTI